MDPDVPLVVPEVNPDALRHIPKGIVANPNCSTIQMVVALKPLHDLAKIKRVVVATYQASSGKGAHGVFELDAQVAALGRNQPLPAVQTHAAQLAGNVLPHDWKAGEEGYTEEEWKMIRETHKIMGDDTIRISATTAHVPVRIGHSEAINVEFHNPISVEQAPRSVATAPGIILQDDLSKGEVPLALAAAGATRCSSAAFAAIRPCRMASISGSSQTTCARERQPMRSRSPKCWSPVAGCHGE